MRVSAITPKINSNKQKSYSPQFKSLCYNTSLNDLFEYTPEELRRDTESLMHINLNNVAKKYPKYAVIVDNKIPKTLRIGIEREDEYAKSGFFKHKPNWKRQIISFELIDHSRYKQPYITMTECLPKELEFALQTMQKADEIKAKTLQEFPELNPIAVDWGLKEKFKPVCQEINERIAAAVKKEDDDFHKAHPGFEGDTGVSSVPLVC